jgi:hypothetical protein
MPGLLVVVLCVLIRVTYPARGLYQQLLLDCLLVCCKFEKFEPVDMKKLSGRGHAFLI